MAREIASNTEQAEVRDDFFDHQSGAFFRKVDWLTFFITFAIAFGVYVYTLSPTVSLEDSGELAVASDYLGVPHPPGYPIWTLVTWFFQWVFHFDSYNGSPNPAWAVGLASAFFGALAAAIIALLVSRSGADILRGLAKETRILGRETESAICLSCGISGGLLLAFSSVLWSQSTIVEVYSLNAFFLALLLILIYRWMCRPQDDKILYATAFIFGLGLTNHQSLLFLVLALLTGLWFRDRRLFRDALSLGFILIAVYLWYSASKINVAGSAEALRDKQVKVAVGFVFLFAPLVFLIMQRSLFTEWKRVLIVFGLLALGVSFYAYMPVASEQNPPMNWGYPRTTEGFMHALTRGQYEKISPMATLRQYGQNQTLFFRQLWAIILNPGGYNSVVAQFTWILSLFVLVPFAFLRKITRQSRAWIWATLTAFLSMTVIFIVFQNPQLDVQTLFIGRVQYIQAHAVFALWISYGLMFALVFLESRAGWLLRQPATICVLLLPLVPILRNAYDKEFVRIIGGCEQNGHTFGWQFGNWQLRGVNGIEDDLRHWLSPDEFEKEWADYPTPGYPPEMGTNAIFFGGTDPGRFVPTYMIYSAKVRRDVFLITQNALADNTYMNVMRDLMGNDIWIPSQQDSNLAFQQYVRDVQEGRIPPGAEVSFKDGRVSVQGVQGVMMINGILAQMIFEHNKYKHPFYVEESYVIPWMYPYLEPHGLIMKINPEPLPGLTPKMVENDRKFWAWYKEYLTSNPKFRRDVVARKTFSKLRSAIAGLYAARRMMPEAEEAFTQAIDLYPLSPEANFRLAELYMQQRKFTQAKELIQNFLKLDKDNDKVESFLNQIVGAETSENRRMQLEAQLSGGGATLDAIFELSDVYLQLNMQGSFEQLMRRLLEQPGVPENVYMEIGQRCANAGRIDLLGLALEKYLAVQPNNDRAWFDYAAVKTMAGRQEEAISALTRAVQLGGEPIRKIAREDPRLEPLRSLPEYQKLIPAPRALSLPRLGL